MENKTGYYIKDAESITGWTSVSAEFYKARLEWGKHDVAMVTHESTGEIVVSVNKEKPKKLYQEMTDEEAIQKIM